MKKIMKYSEYLEMHGYENMSDYDPNMNVEDDVCCWARTCAVCGQEKHYWETVLAIQEENGDWYFICKHCLTNKVNGYDILDHLKKAYHWEEMDFEDYIAKAEGRW